MSDAGQPPAADELWAEARRRYETTDEPVTAIAASLGLHRTQLRRQATARGWSLRPAKARKPSTRTTLQTVRDTLQKRLAQFEQQIDALSEQASSAAASEKDIRAMNLLVRTLEKVLDLERKDRSQRSKLSRERKRLDTAGREELVRRIEALQVRCSPAGERPGGLEG